MKKARLIICGLLLSVALTGCGSSKEPSDKNFTSYGGREFLNIEYGDKYTMSNYSKIYVDLETKVQYLQFDYGRYSSTVVLVDENGKPILYDGEE